MPGDARTRHVQCLEPGRGGTAGRQRQVQVEALAGTTAGFVGMAQVERVFSAWVAVQAHEQHVRALVEEALRPVAMVVVHIEHRHTTTPLRAQPA